MRRIFRESDLDLSADYRSLVGYLTTFQRQGEHRAWDTFRNKLPPELLKTWGDLIIECRRNGFVSPRVENDKIVWRQVISTNDIRNGDLCTMCDRECEKRERIDSGEAKHMKLFDSKYVQDRKCWQTVGMAVEVAPRQPGEDG